MWNYTEKVMDHFLHPRNVGEVQNPDGTGQVGNVSCGDALKLTFKLDKDGRIAEAMFKTFGCASAIASSSALTELIKGMTVEEALKVTNRDIVALLGELPEEKLHCSVMGMEALQAAIANYRGETTEEATAEAEEHEGRLVCRCFGVTDSKILRVARENNLHRAEDITHYCKAGGACGACLDDIQQILDDLWQDEAKKPAFSSLTPVKQLMLLQQAIDTEVAPILAKDRGGAELVDYRDGVATVRLTGHCAGCPASQMTLRHTVAEKLSAAAGMPIEVKSAQ